MYTREEGKEITKNVIYIMALKGYYRVIVEWVILFDDCINFCIRSKNGSKNYFGKRQF